MTFESPRRAAPWCALFTCAVAMLAIAPPTVGAQDLDDLDDLDEGVVLEEVFEPGVESNKWEMTLTFGQTDLAKDLLSMQGVLVDIEEPGELIFSNSRLEGETSFTPYLRIGRTIGRNFALEAGFGFAIGDFEQVIDDENFRNFGGPESDNDVTEEEREKGSYFNLITDLNAVWYPRGEGRIQPYLIGGFGRSFFELDSVYVQDLSSANMFSYGVGLRIVGDDLYSFRLEVRNVHTSIEFATGETFSVVPLPNNAGLVNIPVLQTTDLTFAEARDPANAERLEGLGFNTQDIVEAYAGAAGLSQEEIDQGLDGTPAEVEAWIAANVPNDTVSTYFGEADPWEAEDVVNLWVSVGFTAAF